MSARKASKSSAASGASASLNRCHLSGCLSTKRPPNAASTSLASPMRPAKFRTSSGISLSRALASPSSSPSSASRIAGSIVRSRLLRSMCCDGRASSASQSGLCSIGPHAGGGAATFPVGVGCDCDAPRGARGAGGSIVPPPPLAPRPASASVASCVSAPTRSRSTVAASPPGIIPAVSSVTNVPRLAFLRSVAPARARASSESGGAPPPSGSCESGISGSSAAAAASSSSSLPLRDEYGASGTFSHFRRHASSQRCETMRWSPVWFALAHFAPSNS